MKRITYLSQHVAQITELKLKSKKTTLKKNQNEKKIINKNPKWIYFDEVEFKTENFTWFEKKFVGEQFDWNRWRFVYYSNNLYKDTDGNVFFY